MQPASSFKSVDTRNTNGGGGIPNPLAAERPVAAPDLPSVMRELQSQRKEFGAAIRELQDQQELILEMQRSTENLLHQIIKQSDGLQTSIRGDNSESPRNVGGGAAGQGGGRRKIRRSSIGSSNSHFVRSATGFFSEDGVDFSFSGDVSNIKIEDGVPKRHHRRSVTIKEAMALTPKESLIGDVEGVTDAHSDEDHSQDGSSSRRRSEGSDEAYAPALIPAQPPSAAIERNQLLSVQSVDDREGSVSSMDSRQESTQSWTHTNKSRRRRRMTGKPLEDEGKGESSRSFSREHWLVTAADILYILAATITIIWITFLLHNKTNELDVTPSASTISWFLLVELGTFGYMALMTFVRRRRSEWEVLDCPTDIRHAYVRSWQFAVDIATAVPIELIFLGWLNSGYNIVCARHVLRVVRIFPMHASSNPLMGSRSWHSMVVIVMIVFIAVQVYSMIFLAVESKGDIFDQHISYADALYWAASSITSVGYGDVIASTTQARNFSIVVQFSGVLFVALVTSVGTQYLTTKDPLLEDMEKRKRMMYSLLEFYEIPWDTQKEIIQLFPSVLATQSELQFKEMIESLPAAVSEKIDLYLKEKLLRNFPIFNDIEDRNRVINAAARVLKKRFVGAFDPIIRCGDIGEQMYFIVRGTVEVTVPLNDDEEIFVAALKTGAWFGEVALMERSRRTATVTALVPCELMELSKDDFDNILKNFPALKKKLTADSENKAAETQKAVEEEIGGDMVESFDVPENGGGKMLHRVTTAAVFMHRAQKADKAGNSQN